MQNKNDIIFTNVKRHVESFIVYKNIINELKKVYPEREYERLVILLDEIIQTFILLLNNNRINYVISFDTKKLHAQLLSSQIYSLLAIIDKFTLEYNPKYMVHSDSKSLSKNKYLKSIIAMIKCDETHNNRGLSESINDIIVSLNLYRNNVSSHKGEKYLTELKGSNIWVEMDIVNNILYYWLTSEEVQNLITL